MELKPCQVIQFARQSTVPRDPAFLNGFKRNQNLFGQCGWKAALLQAIDHGLLLVDAVPAVIHELRRGEKLLND